MDRMMAMINFNRDEYITWLVEEMGYTEQDAEDMAEVMGY